MGVIVNSQACRISVNVGRAMFQLLFKCPLSSISSFSLNYGEILLYLTIQEHSSMKTRGEWMGLNFWTEYAILLVEVAVSLGVGT